MSNQNSKPIIFLAFANDRQDGLSYLRNLPEEARRLQHILGEARRAGLCELVLRQNVNLSDILDVFQDPEYRHRIAIFHFGGHANGYQLLLESTGGKTTPAYAGGLAAFLGQQRDLRLVFLNGCSTQAQAQGLLDAGIAVVIATSQAIVDEIAMEFATRFYQGLRGEATVRAAYDEAAAAIQTAHGSSTRALYWAEKTVEEGLLWGLYFQSEIKAADQWSLPAATAEDPLRDLPPVPPGDLPLRPFRHLDTFGRKHAEVFFGRGRQIRELYDKVTDQTLAPIILLYGQTGVGKSSLLAAGLQPRLESQSSTCYRRRERRKGLLGTLQAALNSYPNHGGQEGRKGGLAETWLALEAQSGQPLVLIMDQVEEVYTRPNEIHLYELADFLAALQATLADRQQRPQGKLILSFRKEWLAEIERRLEQSHLPYTKVFLERLGRRDIIEAIEGPTRSERLRQQYGLMVEPGLGEIIADDLLEDRNSAIAPTLQILLTKMWEQAKQQNEAKSIFDLELYLRLKKEGILLKDFLEQQLAALTEWRAEVVNSGLALDVLAAHTTPLGTAEQQTIEQLRKTYPHRADVLPLLVQQCKDVYLLVDPHQNQARQADVSSLAHDALAPLVRWYFEESDAPGQRARRILENRAMEWEDEAEGLPLDEVDLRIVEQGQDGMRAWTEAEERLIRASRVAQAKRERSRRIMWSAGLTAVVLILLFAGVAWWQWGVSEDRRLEANRQTQLALVRQLTAQAELERSRKVGLLETSMLLAVESMMRVPTFEGDQVMRHGLAWLPRMIAEIRHKGNVYGAVFSSDGKWLATVGEDEIVRIWEAATRQEKIRIKHQSTINAIVFSSDSKWLATASEDSTARVWEVASGHELARMEHQGPVDGVIFSSDSKWLVTRSNQTVLVWNPISGREIAKMTHQDSVWAIVFSPNGQWLVTASGDNTVLIWQVNSWQKPIRISNEEAISFVAFSPDSKWLITSDRWKDFFGGSGGQSVWIWETVTGQKVSQLEHKGLVSVAISSDGKWIATAGKDNTARLWELATGREITRMTHEHIVWDVAISPDSKWVATGSQDNTARIWELATGREIARMIHEHEVWKIAFNANSKELATASGDIGYNGAQQVQIWATATGKEETRVSTGVDGMVFSPDSKLLTTWDRSGVRVWEAIARDEVAQAEHEGDVNNLIFSPDGRWLAASSYGDNLVRILEIGTWIEAARLKHTDLLNTSIVFSPNGEWLATTENQVVWIWIITTGQKVARLSHQTPVHAVTFNPNGKWLATGGKDGIVRVWEVETWRKVAELESDGPVNDVAFSPNGKWLAAGGWGKTIRVWEVNSWQEIIRAEKERREVSRIIFSPNSGMMAAGIPGHIVQVWNIPTGTQIAQLEHENDVHCMAFSPNSRWLATCNESLSRVWEVATGKEVSRLSSNDLAAVDTVAFSPDSRWLAINDRQTVRVWEVVSGQEMTRVDNERIGEIRVIAFSRDGKWLAAGGGSHFPTSLGEVRVWLWQPQDLIVEACSRLTRNLTFYEWRKYIGDEEYRPTCPNLPIHESVIIARVEELANQAETFIQVNNMQAASSAYDQATQLAIKTNYALTNDQICWKGSLNGFAAIVLPSCEHAVNLVPSIEGYRYNRGLARALTGDYKGAVEDFEFYVAKLKEQDPRKDTSEQELWIAELESSHNPFDEAMLKELRHR